MKEMTAIDLFCGAGGLSEGFQQAGFTILAGNDFDEHAGATFRLAHDAAEFLPGPIEEIGASRFLKATGLKKRRTGLLNRWAALSGIQRL